MHTQTLVTISAAPHKLNERKVETLTIAGASPTLVAVVGFKKIIIIKTKIKDCCCIFFFLKCDKF